LLPSSQSVGCQREKGVGQFFALITGQKKWAGTPSGVNFINILRALF